MIYISGPMSGMKDWEYERLFEDAVNELLDVYNYDYDDIVNPAYLHYVCNSPKITWDQYMQVDLLWLSYCDTIYMLKGWRNSKGAVMEHEFAVQNHYKIIYQK